VWITGQVTDESGGQLSFARVQVSSPSLKGRVRSATANARGSFTIADLPAGIYTVSVMRGGLVCILPEPVDLSSSFAATINAKVILRGD